MKTLIIEPDTFQRKGLKTALSGICSIDQTFSVSGAIELLSNNSYDIIITEVQFKTEDGSQILDTLLTHGAKSLTIISSASLTPEIREIVEKLDYTFLEKPIDINQLIKIIHQSKET